MTQHLYRHFDKEGALLYIGISLRAINRLGQHRDHSPWFTSIARIEMENYATRAEAQEAERLAIADENPLHNIIRATPKSRKVLKEIGEVFDDDLPDRASKTKSQLLARYVNFYAMYTIESIAQHFEVTTSVIRTAVASKQLGTVLIPPARAGQKPKVRVTGWQLIDYIDQLQSEAELNEARAA